MSKYRAVKTTVDGIRFDSKLEARRYQELRLLEKAGEIANLQLQRRFPLNVYRLERIDKIYVNLSCLVVKSETIVATYVADFCYTDRLGATIIEDVKGMLTPVYRLKKKLFEALYAPLTITEWPPRPSRKARHGQHR